MLRASLPIFFFERDLALMRRVEIHAIAEQRPIYDLSDEKIAKVRSIVSYPSHTHTARQEVTSMITEGKPPAPKGSYPAM